MPARGDCRIASVGYEKLAVPPRSKLLVEFQTGYTGFCDCPIVLDVNAVMVVPFLAIFSRLVAEMGGDIL